MDSPDAGPPGTPPPLESRPPQLADLVSLGRELNLRGARYLVVGGFAVMAAGYARTTEDLDLLVASDLENEKRVFAALASLPDQAVKELEVGELERFAVIRVADEIIVDLMSSAGGIRFEETSAETTIRELGGVPIPFASPRLLWRMKSVTHREKDELDLAFLRQWFAERGENPPEVSDKR